MSKPTPWKDEYTLLCEWCGYVVEGLDHARPCPECGKPITESLPHHNAGSPWQQHRSLINLIKTWFLTLFRSKRLFRQLNINVDTAMSLMWIGLFTGFAIPVLGVVIATIINSFQYEFYPEIVGYIMGFAIIHFIFWIIAVVYSSLGVLRLRYFAHLRGIRLPPSSRWTIIGHASLGLTIAPIGITVSILIGYVLNMLNIDGSSPVVSLIVIAATILAWISIPLALIEFEILLHIGARALRYRNRPTTEDLYESTSPPMQIEPPDAGYRTDIT